MDSSKIHYSKFKHEFQVVDASARLIPFSRRRSTRLYEWHKELGLIASSENVENVWTSAEGLIPSDRCERHYVFGQATTGGDETKPAAMVVAKLDSSNFYIYALKAHLLV